MKAYTKGASDLADGITAYVAGETEMATKAQGLKQLVTGLPKIRTSLNKLYQSVDGKGDKDLLAGAKTLAGGLAQLEAEIEGTDVTSLIQLVDSMIASGKELISEAGTMQGILNDEISGPMTEMLTTGAKLQQGVSDLSGKLEDSKKQVATLKDTVNKSLAAQIKAENEKLASAQQTLDAASETFQSKVDEVNAQIGTVNKKIEAFNQEAAQQNATAKQAVDAAAQAAFRYGRSGKHCSIRGRICSRYGRFGERQCRGCGKYSFFRGKQCGKCFECCRKCSDTGKPGGKCGTAGCCSSTGIRGDQSWPCFPVERSRFQFKRFRI